MDEQRWNGRRYYPISQYFKSRFGGRVAKISVSIAETCPNRKDDNDDNACVFCDEWGSAAYHLEQDRPLSEQIEHNRRNVARRYKNNQFLVYFQSYTNTFDRVATLESRFNTALSHEGIEGLVLGTRPDCLPSRIFPLFEKITKRSYLLVELGLQTFFDDQLTFLKRGHSADINFQALAKLEPLTHVDVGVHLIFGMPGDSEQRIIETAKIINSHRVSNVKLHNLHVLTNTELAMRYDNGEFSPDSLEVYAEKVILFLRHLSPTVAVQRLAALSSRWDELVAPKWTAQKMEPLQYIEDLMAQKGVWQGDLYQEDDKSQAAQYIHVV